VDTSEFLPGDWREATLLGRIDFGAGLTPVLVREGRLQDVSRVAPATADLLNLDVQEAESRELVKSLAGAAAVPEFRRCDLKDLDAVAANMKAIGPVDVLVNNAANDDRHEPSEVTPQYWDDRIAVNLRHVFFCSQAVIAGMKSRGGGAIVNLGSISWHLGMTNLVIYQTAKAGIEGMTRALARECGPDGIRVTCVVPGNVKTPRQMKWYTPADEAGIVAQQCLKARLHPENVASLVLFLASHDGRMCTGHEYWIDAGWR
jgi:NAD(P)-dependent dehydrogenase (short-subunit alcohol dehydrogenase family)